MEHRRSKSVSICIYTLSLVLLVGCVPMATDLRESGFKELHEGFSVLEKSPNLNEIIELRNVKVYIVGDRRKFSWYKAAADEKGLALEDAEAREIIYGMPYADWKAKYQTPASAEQLAKFAQRGD